MKKLSYLALILAIGFASCESPVDPAVSEEESTETEENFRPIISLSKSETDVVYGQTGFAFDCFKKLQEDNKEPNFMFSPLSLSMDLSMLATGAEGDTRAEILSTLGFENVDIADVNAFNARIVEILEGADKHSKVKFANSIWLDNTLDAKASFIDTNRDVYGAEIFRTRLASFEAQAEINKWISDKTDGLIPDMLEDALDPEINILLANTIYFKSIWAQPFAKINTKKGTFTNANGTTAEADMMRGEIHGYAAHDSDGAHWLELAYGNHAYNMLLILPDEGVDLNEYISNLTADTYNEMSGYSFWQGKISLPRFTVKSNFNLAYMLISLGMETALGINADYSAITDGKLCFGGVMQKTYLKVDEEGTEAAAATATGGYTSPGPALETEFIFNRPFAFIIRESSTNSILFMGRVAAF